MGTDETADQESNTRTRSKILNSRTILSLFLVGILIAGFALFQTVMPPRDFPGPATGSVIIQIHPGDSIAVIANTLKSSNVISSVDRFVAVANQNPAATKIQPGKYKLGTRIPVAQALAELLNLKNKIVDGVLIPEGLRASTILKILSDKTGIPESDFQQAITNPEQLGLPTWAQGQLEGFLFPATYDFPKSSTAESILKAMVKKAVQEFSAIGLPDACAEKDACSGLSAHEILIGASIMQAEVHPRDFNKVARVILNRLEKPMRLQMDSTVAYGRNKKQVMLSDEDLSTDTPYNTFLHDGLTPSPISNPGVEAVKAMLNPDDGDWLYFITVNLKTQETKFTKSYEEFLRFNDEFLTFCQDNPGSC